MKKITLMLLSLLILSINSAQAVRVLEILERSYELRLSDVSLPRSGSEAIGYKPCSTCAYSYMHVSDATAWYLGDRIVTLADLLEEAARIRRISGASERTLVMLHYDPETGVATRIRLEGPRG